MVNLTLSILFFELFTNMNSKNSTAQVIFAGSILIFGFGFTWIGTRLFRNENRLLNRSIELELALEAKSKKARRRLLLGR